MIGWLVGTRIGRAIGGALAAVGLFLGIIAHQRRDAARDALQDARERGLRDESERLEKGRKAVADGRGADPADRLRRNNGSWQ